MEPLFFPTPGDWRRWLAAHHKKDNELWVGFYKRASGKPSITWPESVDEALCFGWIDGLRRSVDETSYTIRFTPRRSGSTWSRVNVKRMAELIEGGRVKAAGLKAYHDRSTKKTGLYSFEQRRTAKLSPAYQRRFKANADAWRFFTAQAPWYQRTATFWVISAKREETRLKRLDILISACARGGRIGPLTRNKP